DDLPDGGAQVFAATIRAVRDRVPGCTVEVLVPDFSGDSEALDVVLDAHPEVLGHNLETVLRLYPRVRPRAQYRRSLDLLEAAKKKRPDLLTKSGIMLGLGEIPREIFRVMEDLRGVHCDILTLGQYLRPSIRKLPVERYYPPREFEALRKAGMDAGFRWVEAGPLVRSSYHAATPVQALRT
ncbi:MAG TPA: lipoyl synthase, partial [Syntrophobacteraceae bacterium]|nr:lipoyl synthase [Syntrophobacteraceae bacterium]